jgi:hypothetical protein
MIVEVGPKTKKSAFPAAKASGKRKEMRAMAYGTVNGKPLTSSQHEDHQQQELEQQDEVKQRAEALALKLAQTYEELTRLLERNTAMKRQIT